MAEKPTCGMCDRPTKGARLCARCKRLSRRM